MQILHLVVGTDIARAHLKAMSRFASTSGPWACHGSSVSESFGPDRLVLSEVSQGPRKDWPIAVPVGSHPNGRCWRWSCILSNFIVAYPSLVVHLPIFCWRRLKTLSSFAWTVQYIRTFYTDSCLRNPMIVGWLISIFCWWLISHLADNIPCGWLISFFRLLGESSKLRCWNRHDYPTESSLIDLETPPYLLIASFMFFFPQVTIGFPMFFSVFDMFQASPSLRHRTGSSLEPLEFGTHSVAIKVNKNHRETVRETVRSTVRDFGKHSPGVAPTRGWRPGRGQWWIEIDWNHRHSTWNDDKITRCIDKIVLSNVCLTDVKITRSMMKYAKCQTDQPVWASIQMPFIHP